MGSHWKPVPVKLCPFAEGTCLELLIGEKVSGVLEWEVQVEVNWGMMIHGTKAAVLRNVHMNYMGC